MIKDPYADIAIEDNSVADPYAEFAVEDPQPVAPVDIDSIIDKYSQQYNVNPTIIRATIGQESGGRTDAMSPKNATGIMQVMPETGAAIAKRLGIQYTNDSLKDPDFNANAGVYLLNEAMDKYEGDPRFASIYYHAGNAGGKTDKVFQQFKKTGVLAVPRTRNFWDGSDADWAAGRFDKGKFTDDYFREVTQKAIKIQNDSAAEQQAAQVDQPAQQPQSTQEPDVSQNVQPVENPNSGDPSLIEKALVRTVAGTRKWVGQGVKTLAGMADAATHGVDPNSGIKPNAAERSFNITGKITAQGEKLTEDAKAVLEQPLYNYNFQNKSLFDAVKNKDWKEAGLMAATGAVESIPSWATMFAGPVGLGVMGTSAALDKAADVEDRADMTTAQKVAEVGGTAALQTFLGNAIGKIFSPEVKPAADLLTKYGTVGIKEMATKGAFDFLTKMGVNTAKSEGAIALTTLAQGIVDKASGMEDVSVPEMLKRTFDAVVTQTPVALFAGVGGAKAERSAIRSAAKSLPGPQPTQTTPEATKPEIAVPLQPSEPSSTPAASTPITKPIIVRGKQYTAEEFAQKIPEGSAAEDKLAPEQLASVKAYRAANPKPAKIAAVVPAKAVKPVEPTVTTPGVRSEEIQQTGLQPEAFTPSLSPAYVTSDIKAQVAETAKRAGKILDEDRIKSIMESAGLENTPAVDVVAKRIFEELKKPLDMSGATKAIDETAANIAQQEAAKKNIKSSVIDESVTTPEPVTITVKPPKASVAQGARVAAEFGEGLKFKSVGDAEVGDGETIVPHSIYFDDTARKTTFSVPFGLKDNEVVRIIKDRQAEYDENNRAEEAVAEPVVESVADPMPEAEVATEQPVVDKEKPDTRLTAKAAIDAPYVVPERNEAQENLGKLLARAKRRQISEGEGQNILDSMDENGISPKSVGDEFWSSTYDKLSGERKKKFEKYLKNIVGLEPGSVTHFDNDGKPVTANNWKDVAAALDWPENTEGLEGTERGFVSLMAYANESVRVNDDGDAPAQYQQIEDLRKATKRQDDISDAIVEPIAEPTPDVPAVVEEAVAPSKLVEPSDKDRKAVAAISKGYKNANVNLEVVPGETEPLIKVTSPKGNIELYVPLSDSKNIEKRVLDHIKNRGLGASGVEAVEERAAGAEASKLKARQDKKKMSPLAKEMRVLTAKQQSKLAFVESVLGDNIEYDQNNKMHRLAVSKYQDGGGFADLKKVGGKMYMQPNEKTNSVVENIKYGESKSISLDGEESGIGTISENKITKLPKEKNLLDFDAAKAATLAQIEYGRTKYDPESPLHRRLVTQTSDSPAYAVPDQKTGKLSLTPAGEELVGAWREDNMSERVPETSDLSDTVSDADFAQRVGQSMAVLPENARVVFHRSNANERVSSEYGSLPAAKEGGAYMVPDKKNNVVHIVVDSSAKPDVVDRIMAHEPGHVAYRLLKSTDSKVGKEVDSLYERSKKNNDKAYGIIQKKYSEKLTERANRLGKTPEERAAMLDNFMRDEWFARHFEQLGSIMGNARKEGISVEAAISAHDNRAVLTKIKDWVVDHLNKVLGRAPTDSEISRMVAQTVKAMRDPKMRDANVSAERFNVGKNEYIGDGEEAMNFEPDTKPVEEPKKLTHYDRIEAAKDELYGRMLDKEEATGKPTPKKFAKMVEQIKDVGDARWRAVTKVFGDPTVEVSDHLVQVAKDKLFAKLTKTEERTQVPFDKSVSAAIDNIKAVGDEHWTKATQSLKYTPKIGAKENLKADADAIAKAGEQSAKDIEASYMKSKGNRKKADDAQGGQRVGKKTDSQKSRGIPYEIAALESAITTPEQLAYQADGDKEGGLTAHIIQPLKAGEERTNKSYYERREHFREGLDGVDVEPMSQSMSTLGSRVKSAFEKADKKVGKKKGVEAVVYTSADGKDFDLTPAERATIYLTAKMKDGHKALTQDGFKFQKSDVVRKFSEEELAKLVSDTEANARDMKVVKVVSDYFKTKAAKALNEMSESIWGKKIATDENHFPLVRDGADVDKTSEYLMSGDISEGSFRSAMEGVSADGRPIEGADIVKDKVKGASAPIMILDVFEAVARHGEMLDKVVGFAKPMRDAKLFFSKVESTLNRTYEHTAVEMKKMFHDIEVGPDQGGWADRAFNKYLYNPFAVGTLGLNPTSILSQGASIPILANEFGWQNLSDGLMSKTSMNQIHEEMREHNVTLFRRSDRGVSREHGDSKRQSEARALKKDRLGYSDIVMAPIGTADKFVLKPAWEGTKAEAVKKGYKKDSAEYWKYVGKRAEEIVRRTQQTYSIVDRASANRSNKIADRVFTAFMSQQFKMYSLIKRELPNVSNGTVKDRVTSAGKLINLIATPALVTTAIQMGKLALVGSDEEKEKYGTAYGALDTFVGNAVTNVPVFEKAINGIIGAVEAEMGYKSWTSVGDVLKVPGGDLAQTAAELYVQIKKNATATDSKGNYLSPAEYEANAERMQKNLIKLSKNLGVAATPIDYVRRIATNLED